MRKRIGLLISMILCFFSVSYVKADTCDSTDIARLKVLAQEVDISYSWYYNEEYEYSSYNLYIYNVTDELYLKDESNNTYYYSDLNDDGNIYIPSGEGEVKIYVYSVNCNKKLRTITLDLPIYNIYANYEECDDIDPSELDVCDEWYGEELTYNTFIEKVNEYKESLEEDNTNSFIENYYIYIITGIIILVILFIIIKIIKGRRSVLK